MSEILTRHLRPRETPVDDEIPQGKRYALVVGVDAYREPIDTLNNAVKDAEAIAEKLKKDFGFEVRTLVDEAAEKDIILDMLERWKVETKTGDSLLIFFAGHGDHRPDEQHGLKGFLLPVDSNMNADTWISESSIVQIARDMPASYVFLIFDACYSGTTFRDDIPPGARDDQVLKALVAGTEDQPVLDGGAGDHSIFTRAVLDGLEGFADSGQRPDDVITAGELITYVRSEVPWRSRLKGHLQAAIGGSLQGNPTGADFRFVPVKSRLKAPILRNLYSPEYQDRIAAAEQLGISSNDTPESGNLKAIELQRLLAEDRNRDVRKMAAKSLGSLGSPDGIEALVKEMDSGRDSVVQGSAAVSLGVLSRSILDSKETEAKEDVDLAVQSLVNALQHDEAATRQAVKEGLSHIPESADQIGEILDGHNREHHLDALDALAFIADRNSDSEIAWPPLERIGYRIRRRVYLVRLRLKRLWPEILRPILGVGFGGAIGLGLAYFLMDVVVLKDPIIFGIGVLSICLLPGAFAGAGLAFMPHLVRAVFRNPGKSVTFIIALLGGIPLSFGMGFPNGLLDIGNGPIAWLLPGLLSGALIGLALSLLPLKQLEEDRFMREENAWRQFIKRVRKFALHILAITAIGFLSFAVTRSPEWLSMGNIEPHSSEVLYWGFGGAIFGCVIAISWIAWPLSTFGDLLFRERGE
jgi:hypothetical protein